MSGNYYHTSQCYSENEEIFANQGMFTESYTNNLINSPIESYLYNNIGPMDLRPAPSQMSSSEPNSCLLNYCPSFPIVSRHNFHDHNFQENTGIGHPDFENIYIPSTSIGHLDFENIHTPNTGIDYRDFGSVYNTNTGINYCDYPNNNNPNMGIASLRHNWLDGSEVFSNPQPPIYAETVDNSYTAESKSMSQQSAKNKKSEQKERVISFKRKNQCDLDSLISQLGSGINIDKEKQSLILNCEKCFKKDVKKSIRKIEKDLDSNLELWYNGKKISMKIGRGRYQRRISKSKPFCEKRQYIKTHPKFMKH